VEGERRRYRTWSVKGPGPGVAGSGPRSYCAATRVAETMTTGLAGNVPVPALGAGRDGGDGVHDLHAVTTLPKTALAELVGVALDVVEESVVHRG